METSRAKVIAMRCTVGSWHSELSERIKASGLRPLLKAAAGVGRPDLERARRRIRKRRGYAYAALPNSKKLRPVDFSDDAGS
jgi:hypothetical protein